VRQQAKPCNQKGIPIRNARKDGVFFNRNNCPKEDGVIQKKSYLCARLVCNFLNIFIFTTCLTFMKDQESVQDTKKNLWKFW
jgi:hypothetical protein